MSNPLTQLLSERQCLLADGATGTNLFLVGLEQGEAPELWNLDQPEKIAAHYRSFVEAGSDIILTNTFGGTRYRLKNHVATDANVVAQVNKAAAQLALEEAAKVDRKVLVAGSIGPTGEILAPLGEVTIEEAEAAFKEQAEALAAAGVDVLWVETMSHMDELQAAIRAAQSTGKPVVCTMSFDTNGRSMMGVTPADLANLAEQSAEPILGVGSNCGVGPAELLMSIVNMRKAAGDDLLVIAKGNCGLPYFKDDALHFDGTPELMSDYVRLAIDAGANIIGGCCGTSPMHIRAMREAMDGHVKGDSPTIERVIEVLGEVSTGATAQYHGKMEVTDGSASGRTSGRTRRRRG